ncbi:MAG: EamA family transporter RarD [Thermoanaerobaculia bacterium]
MNEAEKREVLAGVLYGVAAYGWWGLAVIYFKAVGSVGALEILAHRIVWSVVVLAVILTAWRRWGTVRAVLASRASLLFLGTTTVLIAVNWFVFIWAVTHARIVEASLGYFINPLVSVLLGFVVLRERLRPWEWASVCLAGIAVVWLTVAAGVFPWISLVLAFSFGLYGLLRKMAGVASLEGLTIETTLLVPIAGAYLVWRGARGTLAFGETSVAIDVLLVAAGPVTALPLLWFASAVRRLRLATVGLLQYIAPSLQFALAVTVYGEPFGGTRLVAFALIWTAIALYSGENLRFQLMRRSRE